MIEETAIVLDVNSEKPERVLIQVQKKSACHTCSSNTSCGTSLLSKLFNKKPLQLSIVNSCQAKPGDHVLIGLDENDMLNGSVSLYLIPIITMIIFALLGLTLANALSLSSALRDFLTLVTMIPGFYLSRYLIRNKSSSVEPKMIKIINQPVISNAIS